MRTTLGEAAHPAGRAARSEEASASLSPDRAATPSSAQIAALSPAGAAAPTPTRPAAHEPAAGPAPVPALSPTRAGALAPAAGDAPSPADGAELAPVAGTHGIEVFGSFRIRAIGGGPLRGARLFRSCELAGINAEEASFLVNDLHIASIYDIRNQWEVAANQEPYLVGTKMVALEPSTEHRRKDAQSRLVAGVIGEYGKPEERMRHNYRRYAREYPLIGTALRSMAAEHAPALVHCVNGKDRTVVLCAVLLRASGVHSDDVMNDYLATNDVNAARIAQEAEQLGRGMTDGERAVLLSFLEARPSYLQSFFDEVETIYGSFDRYVGEGLRLTLVQRSCLASLLAR